MPSVSRRVSAARWLRCSRAETPTRRVNLLPGSFVPDVRLKRTVNHVGTRGRWTHDEPNRGLGRPAHVRLRGGTRRRRGGTVRREPQTGRPRRGGMLVRRGRVPPARRDARPRSCGSHRRAAAYEELAPSRIARRLTRPNRLTAWNIGSLAGRGYAFRRSPSAP